MVMNDNQLQSRYCSKRAGNVKAAGGRICPRRAKNVSS
jgi:hypothetical protein